MKARIVPLGKLDYLYLKEKNLSRKTADSYHGCGVDLGGDTEPLLSFKAKDLYASSGSVNSNG